LKVVDLGESSVKLLGSPCRAQNCVYYLTLSKCRVRVSFSLCWEAFGAIPVELKGVLVKFRPDK